jgi:tetratricopeptide (TPR) repeat protein
MNVNEAIQSAFENYQAGNLERAKQICRKILIKQPNNFDALHLLGVTYSQLRDYDLAIKYLKKAIYFDSNFPAAYNNLGIALCLQGQFDDAVTRFRKAIELNPNFAEAYDNLGNALRNRGILDDAITHHQKALHLNPSFAQAHWNLSLAYLLSGNLNQGWKEYEWRWKAKEFLKLGCVHHPSKFSQPEWDGSSLKEKTLFIFTEQGVGDEIMFASCYPDLIDQVKACIVECDKRLIAIFSRSFPRAVFVERVKETDAYASQFPQTDMVIPIGSLPKFLRTDIASFPRRKFYLIPDEERVQSWHNRLKKLGEGLNVGISWRGGGDPNVKRRRSIMLEQLAKPFSLSGVHFINLQYGDCKDELKEVKEKLGTTIHDWEDANPLKDLDNFAAQISALDLVISVDNATVHMAGALGKPVWTLLPFVPDWRWMLTREDTLWYPTMRLCRQPSPGDWESVIVKVKNELVKLLGNN